MECSEPLVFFRLFSQHGAAGGALSPHRQILQRRAASSLDSDRGEEPAPTRIRPCPGLPPLPGQQSRETRPGVPDPVGVLIQPLA